MEQFGMIEYVVDFCPYSIFTENQGHVKYTILRNLHIFVLSRARQTGQTYENFLYANSPKHVFWRKGMSLWVTDRSVSINLTAV